MIAIRSATTALAVLSVLALSACTPTAPPASSSTASPSSTATATASPTPTPTPEAPVAAAVVVSATSIAVLDGADTVIVDIPFTTNGDAAADQLAEALGAAPSETVREQTNCARPGTLYDFGGLVIDGPGGITKAPTAEFTVQITSATTAGGVAVRGPGGLQIGSSLADALAAIPGSVPPEEFDGVAVLTFEAISGAGTLDEIGMFGRFNGGSLVFIGGPIYIFGDC